MIRAVFMYDQWSVGVCRHIARCVFALCIHTYMHTCVKLHYIYVADACLQIIQLSMIATNDDK